MYELPFNINIWIFPGTTPPEKTESSPFEVPIIMWNSLIGDSVSTNPVHVHIIGVDC